MTSKRSGKEKKGAGENAPWERERTAYLPFGLLSDLAEDIRGEGVAAAATTTIAATATDGAAIVAAAHTAAAGRPPALPMEARTGKRW